MVVLPLFFEQRLGQLTAYIVIFPGFSLLWQSKKHGNVKCDVFCILSHQLHVLFPPQGMVAAMLEICTLETT
jgi:hypothetical protein